MVVIDISNYDNNWFSSRVRHRDIQSRPQTLSLLTTGVAVRFPQLNQYGNTKLESCEHQIESK